MLVASSPRRAHDSVDLPILLVSAGHIDFMIAAGQLPWIAVLASAALCLVFAIATATPAPVVASADDRPLPQHVAQAVQAIRVIRRWFRYSFLANIIGTAAAWPVAVLQLPVWPAYILLVALVAILTLDALAYTRPILVKILRPVDAARHHERLDP